MKNYEWTQAVYCILYCGFKVWDHIENQAFRIEF